MGLRFEVGSVLSRRVDVDTVKAVKLLGSRQGRVITTIISVVFGTFQETLFSQDLRVLSGKKEDSCQHLAPYGVFFFFFKLSV